MDAFCSSSTPVCCRCRVQVDMMIVGKIYPKYLLDPVLLPD